MGLGGGFNIGSNRCQGRLILVLRWSKQHPVRDTKSSLVISYSLHYLNVRLELLIIKEFSGGFTYHPFLFQLVSAVFDLRVLVVGRPGVLATNSCAVFGSVVIPDSNLTLQLLLAFLKPGTASLNLKRERERIRSWPLQNCLPTSVT